MTEAHRLRTRSTAGTLCVCCLAVAMAFGGCKDKQPPQEAPRYVRTITLAAGSVQGERKFSGITQADMVANLSFKVPGLVTARPVEVGQKVKTGELVAVLEKTDYQLKLKQAQAALARAHARARAAEVSYQRMRRLYENRSISPQELDDARGKAETTKAQQSAEAQAVSLARTQLSYCELKAPADGEIAATEVDINENVDAGRTIAVLNSGDLPKVSFDVPESFILYVKQGAPAKVTVAALDGESFEATVTEVGVAAGGTAYPVTVRLSQPAPRVRAGMAAEVQLTFDASKKGTAQKVLVPGHAVMEDSKGRFAYVAEGKPGNEGTIKRRELKTAELTTDGLEVTEGLRPGDHVVIAGLRSIKPGQRVRIQAK